MTDTYALDDFDQDRQMARSRAVGYIGANPDEAARAVELGRYSDTPPSLIVDDLDTFEQEQKAKLAGEIVGRNQHISDLILRDPMAARLANDDYGNLDEASTQINKLTGKGFIGAFNDAMQDAGMYEHAHAWMYATPEKRAWAERNPIAAGAWGGLINPLATSMQALTAAVNIPIYMLGELSRQQTGYDDLEKISRKVAAALQDPGLAASFGFPIANPFAMFRPSRRSVGLPDDPSRGVTVTAADITEFNNNILRAAYEIRPWLIEGKDPPAYLHPAIDEIKAVQNEIDVANLEESVQIAQKSSLRERSPETYARFIEQHTDATISIDAQAVAALYGTKLPELEDGLLGWVPRIKEQLEAATQYGGDIEIPLGAWLANVDPQVAKGLREDIRVRPGAVTIREAQALPEAPLPALTGRVLDDFRTMLQVDPLFDRKVKLRKIVDKPKESAVTDAFGSEAGFHNFEIMDQNGEAVGYIVLSEQKDGKLIYVEDVSAVTGGIPQHFFGPRLIRDLFRQIKEEFPLAERATGYRVSGARDKAGSWKTHGDSWVVDFTRLDNPEAWAKLEEALMPKLSGGEWFKLSSRVDLYAKPTDLLSSRQMAVVEAVEAEIARIAPKGVEHTPGQRVLFDGQPVNAVYQMSAEHIPLIVWALENPDAIGTIRHEVIHHLRRYSFFTEQEWGILERTALQEGWIEKYNINERYPDADIELKIEEAIAEGYRHWRKGQQPASGPIKVAFERLFELMEAIRNKVTKIFGVEITADDLFTMVDAGEIGKRDPGQPMDPGARSLAQQPDIRPPPKVKENYVRFWGTDSSREVYASRRPGDTHYIDVPKGDEIERAVTEAGVGEVPEGSKFRPIDRVINRRPREEQLEMTEMTRMGDREIVERAAAIGLTEKQYRLHLENIDKMSQDDLVKSYDRAMRDITRRETAAWKASEKPIREQVVKDINLRPDVAAERYFYEGMLYDDQQPARPTLDPSFLTPEQREAFPKTFQSTRGQNPNEVAGLFGFQSGDELIEAVIGLNQARGKTRREDFRREMIRNETTRRMESQHGNLRENILEQVKDQVFSEAQLDMLHEELLALGLQSGTQYSLTKADVKKMVLDQFHETPYKTLSSDKYIQAASKAGRAAELALLKGDPLEAFRTKQQQFVAIIAAKEARAVERQQEQFARQVKRFTPREVKGIDLEYTNYIQALLTQVGIPTRRTVPELMEAIGPTSLPDFVAAKISEGWDLAIAPDILMQFGNLKQLNQMTVGEFLDFKNAIDSLYNAGRKSELLRIGEQQMAFADFRVEVLENIKQLPVRGEGRNWFFEFDASLTRMEEIAKDLDLRKELGPIWRGLIQPMMEAKAKEYTMLQELVDKLREIKGFDKKWQRTLNDPIPQNILVDPIDGIPFDLSRQQMINIMLNFGNQSSIEKFTRGWVERGLSSRDAKAAAGMLDSDLRSLFERHATKADWDFVQKVWDSIDYRKEISELAEDMSGVPPKFIEPQQIVTPHGSYRGGYFPVIFDKRRSHIEDIKAKTDPDALFGGNYYRASTPHGYANERTGYFDYIAFDGTLEETAARMQQTIHDLAYRPAVMQANRILSDKTIRAAIRNHYGQEYLVQADRWVKDVANHFNVDEVALRAGAVALRRVRMNLVYHALGFSARVALSPGLGQQGPVGIAKSAGRVMNVTSRMAENTKLAYEKSLEIPHTLRNMDRDIREKMESLVAQNKWSGFQAEAIRWSFKPMLHIEQSVRITTWVSEYKGALGRGLNDADAILVADSAIRTRHGAAGIPDLPAILRGGEFLKVNTMFYTYFNAMYNWQRQIKGQLSRGEYLNAMTTTYGAIIVPAAFGAVFFNQAKEDDSWFKTIAKALVLQPLSTIVFAREFANYFIEGYQPKTPLESLMVSLGTLGSDLHKYSQNRVVKKPIQHTANALGLVVGVPGMAQVGRTGQFFHDVNQGRQRPRNIMEWMRGIIHGESQLKR